MNDKYQRFKDAPWFNFGQETYTSYKSPLIGGIGGIGSWLALFLSRAGFKTVVCDNDRVETINLAGQLYSNVHVGQLKVDAIFDVCNKLGTVIPDLNDVLIQNLENILPYSFSCFDSMAARKVMFDRWVNNLEMFKTLGLDVAPIFIDGRLTANQFQIFCVTEDKIQEYRKNLFDDKDIPDTPCSFKQTSHISAMIASFMTSYFTNHIVNGYSKEIVYTVPFKTDFFSPLNMFEYV